MSVGRLSVPAVAAALALGLSAAVVVAVLGVSAPASHRAGTLPSDVCLTTTLDGHPTYYCVDL